MLAFGISKWISLNWCDDGLRRFFRRVHKSLHAGGRFILEPQNKHGYRREAKHQPELTANLHALRFWPEHFQQFLLNEVGFVHVEALETPLVEHLGASSLRLLCFHSPFATMKTISGCDPPLLMFYKASWALFLRLLRQKNCCRARSRGKATTQRKISLNTSRARRFHSSAPRQRRRLNSK